MPIYLYKGYDLTSGANRKGKIDAESLRTAKLILRTREKVMVADIKEEVNLARSQQKPAFSIGGKKVSLVDLAVMTRQFATLQLAHVPLDESLKALTEQVENMVLRNTMSGLKEAVSEGKSLGDAMSAYPSIFNRLYVNMVKAGESSGSLGVVLVRLADFIEYQVAVRGKIFSAMTYPSVMIAASMAIIVYLFVSVVPKLEKVFVSLKVVLPWYSKALIGFSKVLQAQWYLFIAGGVLIFLGIRAWYRSPAGRLRVDGWALRAPIFSPVVIRINVSKFTKTLSTLLSSGVPIITALEITKNVIDNQLISGVIEDAKKAVQEGEPLWATIERSKRFPPLVTHMIRTGEKTGELEQMLRHVSEAYDAEVERRIDAMISLVEPLMIIVMAGVIVVVVLAMLIPMLSVMNQVR